MRLPFAALGTCRFCGKREVTCIPVAIRCLRVGCSVGRTRPVRLWGSGDGDRL